MVEELRGQMGQLQDVAQQSIANAGAASSGEFPPAKSTREKSRWRSSSCGDVEEARREVRSSRRKAAN